VPLDARDHRQIQSAVKTTRNAAARQRRAAQPTAANAVRIRILEADDVETGRTIVLAIDPKEPARAYVLERLADDAWGCQCFVNRWRRSCAHVQAAALADAVGKLRR
jgi:hypothetical protein